MAAVLKQAEAGAVEQALLELIRELLAGRGKSRAVPRVSLAAHLDRDLGLESLDLFELLLRCEARFEVSLPEEILHDCDTAGEWARAILTQGRAVQGPPERARRAWRDAPVPPGDARTVLEVLSYHAELEPERVQVHLLGGRKSKDITYQQLVTAAQQVAAGLGAFGLRRGDTVAIMLPTGAEFFHAFLGVLLAGGTPVPLYPPVRRHELTEYVRRQTAILTNARARFLVAFDQVSAIAGVLRVATPRHIDVVTVDLLRDVGRTARRRHVDPAELALIQYTSGSTGEPKGVTLTHANILANIRAIGAAVDVRRDDAVVSWLPLCSDVGLIGSWLFSLYYGTPLTCFSPLEFLKDPERWLWAIHESRATLSAAPNFAYELCASKVPAANLEGLDLSRWRAAVNAGETVQPLTVRRFTDRFRPFGFRPEAMLPCYGLAEAAVALCMSPLGREPLCDIIDRLQFEESGAARPARENAATVSYYSVGRALPGHEVRVVDERGRDLPQRRQGRLLFRGPSMTAGYFGDDAPAERIDTGDLAYLADGEVFFTGRAKDAIVRAGRLLHPQDIEAAVSEIPGIIAGGVAAVGARDEAAGTEQLVVVAETTALKSYDLARVRTHVAARVRTLLGLEPDAVDLIRPDALPKTANDKLRRTQARLLYEAGRLHSRRRSVLRQMIGLWLRHAPGKLRALFRSVRSPMKRIAVVSLGIGAGLWLRLAALQKIAVPPLRGNFGASFRFVLPRPARRLAADSRLARGPARVLFRMAGRCAVLRGDAASPAVLLVNRVAAHDPLALVAALSSPLALADGGAVSTLPRSLRFMLQPLVVRPVAADLEHALAAGRSVVVFAEGPPGVEPQRSRFRLEAFSAAARTGTPVQPLVISEAGELIAGVPRTISKDEDPARARDRIRREIGELCR